jgi:DNA-binding NtrC family response regulator
MKTALVVDDDPAVLALIERWLSILDISVVAATSFDDARAEILRHEPVLVIADVRLGEFNGLQLGILARDVRPDARLIIISGWDDPVLRADAAKLDALFVHKPLTAERLLAAVGTIAPS